MAVARPAIEAVKTVNRVTPHTMEGHEVCRALKTTLSGLSREEATRRLEIYGPNELPEGKRVTILTMILRQFRSWLVILLIVAAVISALASEIVDMWVIIAVIIINAAIGVIHEIRAEKAVDSLKKMIAHTAEILRDGAVHMIATREIVPGDILLLSEGNNIAADARVLTSTNLRTDESALTGESVPSNKSDAVVEANAAIGDRSNMVWKGTFAVSGTARAVVVATGLNTQLGAISTTLHGIKDERSDFLKKTDTLAKQMSFIAIGSAIVLFLLGYFIQGLELREMLLVSIAALVAAIPEGLPAVLAIVLAIGAHRMAKRNAIIRDFTATETLGAISAILTDKTGTLTMNSLTVRKIFLPDQPEIDVSGEGWFPAGNLTQGDDIIDPDRYPSLKRLLTTAAISNNAKFEDTDDGKVNLMGDPTEGALAILARKGNIDPVALLDDRIYDLPFSSDNKFRATLSHRTDPELYVAGAPEVLLDKCSSVLLPSDELAELENHIQQIRSTLDNWSNHALRVIALCCKSLGDVDEFSVDDVHDLTFIGLVGMTDPARPEVRNAIEQCREAGIRVLMLTGDHINTAVAIARNTGIIQDDDKTDTIALNQGQLEQLDQDEFDRAIKEVSVFARLTPQMKMRIADRLQDMGELVAVTGDGVNDAPALKAADVGVAMGIMGTDIAREASDVVLADDNFATIVNAVEEGRIVFINARQTSTFLITTNIAESLTLMAAIALGMPLPLTATQLLWLNLVTDGVTDVALATEPGHATLKESTTYSGKQAILNKQALPFLFINVLVMSVLALGAFRYFLPIDRDLARTAVFVTMAFTQLFNVFNLRSIQKSIFAIGPFSNRYINIAVLVSALLVVAITYIPTLETIFHFRSLQPVEFLLLVGLSSLVLWGGEIYKALKPRATSTN